MTKPLTVGVQPHRQHLFGPIIIIAYPVANIMERKMVVVAAAVLVVIVAVAMYYVTNDDGGEDSSLPHPYIADDRLGETILYTSEYITNGELREVLYLEVVSGCYDDGVDISYHAIYGNSSDGTRLNVDYGLLTRHVDEIVEDLGTEIVDSPLFGEVETEKFQVKYDDTIWIYDGMVIQWTDGNSLCKIVSMSCFDEVLDTYDVPVRHEIRPGDFNGYMYKSYTGSGTAGSTHWDARALVATSVDDGMVTAVWTHDGSVVHMTVDEFLMGGVVPTGTPRETMTIGPMSTLEHTYTYDDCVVTSQGLLRKATFDDASTLELYCSTLYDGRSEFVDDVDRSEFDTMGSQYYVLTETDDRIQAESYQILDRGGMTRYQSLSFDLYYDSSISFRDMIRHHEFDVDGSSSENMLYDGSGTKIGTEEIVTTYGPMSCDVYQVQGEDSLRTLWVSVDIPGLIFKSVEESEGSTVSWYLFSCGAINNACY